MPDNFQDRYEIISRIGAGGVGAVYKARDTRLGRMVAVKRLLSPDESEDQAKLGSDLIKEARALSAFQHPNIITVFDYGEDEDGLYIIMELLEGETVEEIAQNSQLHVDTLTELAEQCLEGLSVAHGRNLLHRDLKPSNIFVTKVTGGEAQVKLLDFGLAKFSSAPALQTVDQSRSILGSIYFMAPEQFLRQPLDARCDLYQLGCVFFYALTSQYAFDGETTTAVMDAHLDHTPKDLATLRPDVPKALRDWVMSMIAREPEDRPKTAAKALQKLRIIAKEYGLAAQPPLDEEPLTQQVSAITETGRASFSATEVYLQKQKELAEKKSVVRSTTERQISTPVWIGGIGVLAATFVGVIVYALSDEPNEASAASDPEEIEKIEASTSPSPEPPIVAELELDLDASKGVLAGTEGHAKDPAKMGDQIATWLDQAPSGGVSKPSFLVHENKDIQIYQPTYSEAVLLPGKPPRPSVRFSGVEVLYIQSKFDRGADLSEMVNRDGAVSIFVLASTKTDSKKIMGVLNWPEKDAARPLYCLYASDSEVGFAFEMNNIISQTSTVSVPKASGPVLFELGIATNRTSIRITNWGEKGKLLGEMEAEFSDPVRFGKVMKIGGFRQPHRNGSPSPKIFHDFTGDMFSIKVVSGAEATIDQRSEWARGMWKSQ